MSPAEEKIRHVLETNAGRLRTEGPDVVRWLTGGSEPDAYVLLEREPATDRLTARCASCRQVLQPLTLVDGRLVAEELVAVRRRFAGHTCARAEA
ncbi:hypothetical protein [Thermogemmatispora onikobensis]|uniref:hypothetical protein n=1 Tax=Thermogemmatispora onikobensis TaxID=732234 RepID=UPI0008530D88|nr:hypothetical protein [Thermogemmatispora onikobensis]